MADKKRLSSTLLNTFLICPARYASTYITRDYIKEMFDDQGEGIAAHDALDKYIRNATPVGNKYPYLHDVVKFIDGQKAKGRVIKSESTLAMTADYKACGSRSANAWCMGKADYIMRGDDPTKLIIGDWKTGKVKPEPIQSAILALCARANFPQVQMISTIFHFIKHNDMIITTYDFANESEDDMEDIREFKFAVSDYNHACETDKFPAIQNGLCKSYCGNPTCPYNGKYNKG